MGFVQENHTLEEAKAQVGKGWHPLIEEAYSILPEGVRVTQVKEKCNYLRIRTSGHSEELRNKIFDLENKSMLICENCGTKGVPRGKCKFCGKALSLETPI